MVRPKRLAAFAALGVSLALGTYGIAQAATTAAGAGTFAASATAYQNSTVTLAMRNHPAGVRVGPGKVEWDSGNVVMLVPASPDATTNGCPYAILVKWTCVYSRANFRGVQLEFHDAGYAQSLEGYDGGHWVTRSWVNNRFQDAYLFQYKKKHRGLTLCMPPVATGTNSAGDRASHDKYIYLATSSTHC